MKRCTKCGIDKPLAEFFVKNTRRGRRHACCKFCQQRYWREYYHRHPDLQRSQVQRNERYRERNRQYVDDYLRSHPCVDCGLADPIVLEFDHVSGIKRAALCELIRQAVPVATIAAEIEKCEVRCANCHRRRTSQSWRKHIRRPEPSIAGISLHVDR